MSDASLIIVKILQEVVSATDAKVFSQIGGHLDYQPGRASQIKTELQKITDSIATTTKQGKFPLVAVFMDIPEAKGGGYDVTVTFPKISIAMLTVSTDPVLKRYDKTFPILYIIYDEFLRQICRHRNIVAADPGAIQHTKLDRPGDKPETTGINDYLDSIEMSNLQLTFRKVFNCKTIQTT